MGNNMKRWILLSLFCFYSLTGTEYFVASSGNDSASGTSQAPFRTIGRGVKALKAGDILTVLPGEYFEDVEAGRLPSDAAKRTVIRAAVPGTAILRGDVEAPLFSPVPGTKFTYSAPFSGPVEAVNERDTLTLYRPGNALAGMDFERGAWFYDRKEKKLCVVTSDGKAPSEHVLTVSQIAKPGFALGRYTKDDPLRNVTVEGFVITGFNFSGDTDGRPEAVYGINGRYFENCVIRDCDIFLCGGGIRLWRPRGSVVENCRAYANGTLYDGSGGNIIATGPTENCVIRNCLAFGSPKAGIRFYSDRIENCRIENCVGGFNGFGDFWIKGAVKNSPIIGCSAVGNIYPSTDLPSEPPAEFDNVYYYTSYSRSASSLMLWRNGLDRDRHFADPENWDFRPQGGVDAKAGLKNVPEIYFLSPQGNDSNDGRSTAAPWKTLKKQTPGSTVYLLPGVYDGKMRITAPNIRIAARGSKNNVVIRGGKYGIEITAPGVTLDRLNFVGQSECAVKVSAPGVKILKCGFSPVPVAVEARNLSSLVIANNAFTGKPWDFDTVQAVIHSNILPERGKTAGKSELFFHSNAYPGALPADEKGARKIIPDYTAAPEGDFTLRNAAAFNGRGMLGFPIGPWRTLEYRDPAKPIGIAPHAVGSTIANIEYFNTVNEVEDQLFIGESPDKMRLLNHQRRVLNAPFRTFTVNRLAPGKRYFYRVDMKAPKRLLFSNENVSAETEKRLAGFFRGTTGEFVTPLSDPAPRELHVAVSGDDGNPGSAAAPFRTIARAASEVRAGDTVTVHAGTYNESVHLRAGGTRERPILFRAAPGEKVWWEGANQKLDFAMRMEEKSHIRIDGFRLRNFGGRTQGLFHITGGGEFRFTRILCDGRAPNYTGGMIHAEHARNLTVENCFVTRGFHGMTFNQCDNILLRNNLFHINQLTPFFAHYTPTTVTATHNIFFDNILAKQTGPTIAVSHPEKLTAEHNCFHWRIPASARLMTGTLLGTPRGRLTLEQFRALKGGTETNFVADPGIRATPELITFSDSAGRDRKWREEEKNEAIREQGARRDGSFAEWDWPDLFPTNPRCVKGADGLPVGPDPAAFR